jgi:mannose-6-phosphate isomerase
VLYPLKFHPVFMERVWGGRSLERLYGKGLPSGAVIGESWEIADRPEAVSVISNGPLAGRDLRWLIENHPDELLGAGHSPVERFPLLIKILDAEDTLSVQVHPPASAACRLGGEPKTELWYVAEARGPAELWAGLRTGVNRGTFRRRLGDGSVAECLHRVRTRAGDAMFLPSGRVHAIGAGHVIFEIQQNSDTTYRVFDWNRAGLDGKPRALHLPQALASIEFRDPSPRLVPRRFRQRDGVKTRWLTRNPWFTVRECEARAGLERALESRGAFVILGLVSGRLAVRAPATGVTCELTAGEFALIPSRSSGMVWEARTSAVFLEARPGGGVQGRSR